MPPQSDRALLRSLLKVLDGIRSIAESIRENQRTTHSQKPPLLPVVLRTELPLPIVVREYYEAEQRERQSLWSRIRRVLEVLGIAIAFVLAVFTGLTLRVAKQSALSREAIDRSAEAFLTNERAWIEIDSIKKTARPPMQGFPQSFTHEVYLKNVSKTKAKDIVLRKVTSMASLDFMSNLRGIQMTQEQLLKPDANDATSIPAYPVPKVLAPSTVTPIPFTLDGAIAQNNYFRYPVGRVDYADDFGVPHWMRFCFIVFNDAGDLRYCEFGNDEDSNPEMAQNATTSKK